MTTTVLIRDTNGNTLRRFELKVDPDRIAGIASAALFENGDGVVVTLELEEDR